MARPSAVRSGHLHFGLVSMPVRLQVAARTKTTRFRRLYRKPINESTYVSSFPSFSQALEDQDSDPAGEVGETPSPPEEVNARNTAQDQYSTVRQVFQSEATGEEIRPHEMGRFRKLSRESFRNIQPGGGAD